MSNLLASNLTLKRLVFIALAIVSLSTSIDILNAWSDQKQYKVHRTNNHPTLNTPVHTDTIPPKSGSKVQLHSHDTPVLSDYERGDLTYEKNTSHPTRSDP